jgi:two-component sensor histidine kinase
MKNCLFLVLFIAIGRQARSQVNPADIPLLRIQFAQSKPDTQRINICINLAASYNLEGSTPNRMDSAAFYLKKARQLNDSIGNQALRNRISLVSALYQWYFISSDDSKSLFLPVIDSCHRTGDKIDEALAWMYLGYKLDEDPPNYPFKLTCLENGLALASQIGASSTEWQIEEDIAHVHVLQHKFDQAERELLSVLQQTQKTNPIVAMYTYDRMAHLYLSKGESAKALKYALKTMQLAGMTRDSASAYAYFNRIVRIYDALGRETECHAWAKKELAFELANNNIPGVYRNIVVLSALIREEHSPKEAVEFIQKKIAQKKPETISDQRLVQDALGGSYNSLKRYDLAEKCYLEMIRLGNLQAHGYAIWDRAQNNYTMGKFYCAFGLYRKARPFLETALKNYDAYGVVPYKRAALLLVFKADSALGNYVEAIQHLKEADRIGDSIFKVDRNRQIEELQIAYKTQQKDDSIRVLQEKEQVAQLQLQHTKARQNWIFAAAAMLLIIAALLYRLALIRKINNSIVTGKNTQLQHLVEEKDWLMKEIHHRVKNNFHTVMGLLGTQTDYLQNDIAINAITDSQRRIQSMSLIHEKLYQSNNLSAVSLKSYIHELVDFLRTSFNTGKQVRFNLALDPTELELAHCIPLGLILNEAITNSFKYAFPNRREGTITIELTHTADNKILLTIKDDGIGFPEHFDAHRTNSMGMNLIKGLCEQIGAQLTISGDNGTSIDINFNFAPAITTVATDTSLAHA